MLPNVYCSMHTSHSTLYTVHCLSLAIHCIVYTLKCKLNTMYKLLVGQWYINFQHFFLMEWQIATEKGIKDHSKTTHRTTWKPFCGCVFFLVFFFSWHSLSCSFGAKYYFIYYLMIPHFFLLFILLLHLLKQNKNIIVLVLLSVNNISYT